MSRRKQANPAKLGDEDCVELTDLASRDGEHSFIPLRVPTLIAGELDEIQCRACTRYIRSQSSSPTPIKRVRVITHRSFSDGETSRFEEPYECGICYLKFPRSSKLDEHMQIHTDQLQFTCSYCPRLFKHKRSRDRHTKLHTGDKKYRCQQCESAFSRSDHLKIHMRTHDSRKPYKCGTCSRGYNTAAALSSHQQSHVKIEASGIRTSRSTPSPNTDIKEEPSKDALVNKHDTANEITSVKILKISTSTPVIIQRSMVPIQEQNGRINYSNLHKIANRVTIIRDSVKCTICPKVFSSMDIMQLHVMTTHGRRPQNESQNVPNDSRQIANDSRQIANGGRHVQNDSHHISNDSRHVPNDNRLVPNGNRHFQNEIRHSQNGHHHFQNEGMNFQNEGPHFQNNVSHFHADVRHFQNGGHVMSANIASAGTSAQCLSQDQGNSFQTYSNEMRMIYEQPFMGGHNFCTFRSRQIEYLTPTMKDLNPKEGHPLQMIPADLTKKDDINVFQNVCKKIKMDQQNISPSSSPYGLYSQVQTCICPCCSATLPNFQIFMRHMETHIAQSNNSTVSVCPTCGETIKDFESFTNHVFGHCIVQAQGICCGSCKVNFENIEELQKHHHESHVSTVFRCILCNDILENRMSLQMHFSSKHSEECHHSKCTLCPDLVFHDKTSAEVHVSIKHFNQYFQNSNSEDQYAVTNQPRETTERYPERTYKLKCSLFSSEVDDSVAHMSHLVDEHPEDLKKEKKFLTENSTYQQLPPSMSPNILFPSHADPTENMKRFERTPPKSYSCDLCNLTDIPTEIDLLNHKRLQHMRTKIRIVSLNCAYCQEICKSRNDLETHMRGHEMMCGKTKSKCNICDETFPSPILLAEHKLSHCKIVEGNSCVQCKTILVDEQSYYNHTALHSNTHVKSKPQITLPTNCVICCQTLHNSIELNLHATFHLKHLMKKYLCSICNDTFDNIGQNGENENIVFNLFLGVCQKCATDSDTRSTCKRKSDDTDSESKSVENKQIYLANEKNNLECRLCKLMFTSAVKLQIHLIEHNFFGINQYSCYLCSSVFTGASGLRNHMLEHGLQSRPYECNHCQMKFFFRSELDNHIIVHNSSPNIGTPMPIINEPASTTDMNDVTQYEACPYCYNLYLKTVFFAEHVKNCSLKPEMKKVQIIEIDNNDTKENFQSIETSDK